MVRLIGYGEDFLTLWAVTERLDLILKKLGDETAPENCTVFYRPSFGRSQYGEFDAIIVTQNMVYPVESKWRWLLRPTESSIKLRDEQIRRHEILAWYHSNWSGEKWGEFIEKYEDEFEEKFQCKIAPEGSLLSQNLQTVLEYIRGKELRNVLIFFHRGELPEINTDFDIIEIEYEPTHGNFIEPHQDRTKEGMNPETINLLFQGFADFLEDRFSKQVYTTEDSIRYTLFYYLTQKMHIHPSDIIIEYPHTHIPRAKIDTYIPPMEKRPGFIFEFKFNRKMPGGRNPAKSMKAGKVFADIFRLADFQTDNNIRRFFVYITDRLMAVYFQNPSNKLQDFFNLIPGNVLRIDRAYVQEGHPKTFIKNIGKNIVNCDVICHLNRSLKSNIWIHIYEVKPTTNALGGINEREPAKPSVPPLINKNTPASIPEKILEVARKLTSQGKTPFTRKDIKEALPEINPDSLNPIIQSMTENARDGPHIASAYWKKCFKRVARGKYVLLERWYVPSRMKSQKTMA